MINEWYQYSSNDRSINFIFSMFCTPSGYVCPYAIICHPSNIVDLWADDQVHSHYWTCTICRQSIALKFNWMIILITIEYHGQQWNWGHTICIVSIFYAYKSRFWSERFSLSNQCRDVLPSSIWTIQVNFCFLHVNALKLQEIIRAKRQNIWWITTWAWGQAETLETGQSLPKW